MNFTQIAGHLGADPEERRTPTGKKVWRLRVATRVWNDGKDDTLWWDVSVWGDEYDAVLRNLKKGSAVCVIGSLRKPRIWEDREGRPQVTLELTAKIVSFSPFGKADQRESEGGMGMGAAQRSAAMGSSSAAAGAYHYDPMGSSGQEEDDGMPF